MEEVFLYFFPFSQKKPAINESLSSNITDYTRKVFMAFENISWYARAVRSTKQMLNWLACRLGGQEVGRWLLRSGKPFLNCSYLKS